MLQEFDIDFLNIRKNNNKCNNDKTVCLYDCRSVYCVGYSVGLLVGPVCVFGPNRAGLNDHKINNSIWKKVHWFTKLGWPDISWKEAIENWDKKKEFFDYVDKNYKSDVEKATGKDDPDADDEEKVAREKADKKDKK